MQFSMIRCEYSRIRTGAGLGLGQEYDWGRSMTGAGLGLGQECDWGRSRTGQE